ncbi:hypothetical protein L1887_57170 [Cichorium endivia]|nr:hypothetical protein L1887_57170 [Cichorium endivia]
MSTPSTDTLYSQSPHSPIDKREARRKLKAQHRAGQYLDPTYVTCLVLLLALLYWVLPIPGIFELLYRRRHSACSCDHTAAVTQKPAMPWQKQFTLSSRSKGCHLALDHIVPESLPWKHTDEGPDDSASHTKASLIGPSITLPITDGRLNLGTWQGLYLCEMRRIAHRRKIVLQSTLSIDPFPVAPQKECGVPSCLVCYADLQKTRCRPTFFAVTRSRKLRGLVRTFRPAHAPILPTVRLAGLQACHLPTHRLAELQTRMIRRRVCGLADLPTTLRSVIRKLADSLIQRHDPATQGKVTSAASKVRTRRSAGSQKCRFADTSRSELVDPQPRDCVDTVKTRSRAAVHPPRSSDLNRTFHWHNHIDLELNVKSSLSKRFVEKGQSLVSLQNRHECG